MQIELRHPSTLKPYPNNPRLNDNAVEAVVRSIQSYGFRQPLVTDEQGVIIVGHTRWKAAMKLGLSEVPVHVAKGLSPEQANAYRIADNQTATIAEWDDAKLVEELKALQQANFDLDPVGFDADQLLSLLGNNDTPTNIDEDQIPEAPDAAITERGDLWIMGNHRLLCGDSSIAADVDRLVDGQQMHLVHTDPPYNVAVEPRSNNAIAAGLSSFPSSQHTPPATHHQGFDLARDPKKAKATTKKLRPKDRPLANDFLSDADFDMMLDKWFGNASRVLIAGRACYVWGGYLNCKNYPRALAQSGLYFSQAIIWDKQHPVLGRKDFMSAHEWCFYCWKEGAAHQFFGPNNVPDLWQVKKVHHQAMVHLTEKPVELAKRAMEYSSRVGENVLDLFGGSGSTLIAAVQMQRNAFLMEFDELYCDVIVKRWEEFTGKKAVRIPASTTATTQPAAEPEATASSTTR